MPSIIALAGLVGLVAASYAPQLDDTIRASQFDDNIRAPQYNDNFRTSTLDALVPTPYAPSSVFRPVQSYAPQAPRLTSPLVWSTTKYIRTSAFTTFCPEATTLTFNTRTLTVTAATTLTVTDCYDGCQIVRPLPTTTITQTAPVIRTTQLETFCPEPTTLTFSQRTFTVTQATTLTIPQNVTTTSVFRTVIPVQPTFAPVPPVNSTVRISTTVPYVAPVPTYEAPVAPVPTFAPSVIEPFIPRTSSLSVIEPFIPTTTTLNAIIPPYPTVPAATKVWQPAGTGTNRTFATSPVLYTGSANRVGAGALVAVAGFAALL